MANDQVSLLYEPEANLLQISPTNWFRSGELGEKQQFGGQAQTLHFRLRFQVNVHHGLFHYRQKNQNKFI